MAAIGTSVRHNLRHLGRFSGRDSRAQFWPWAIIVFLATQAAGMLLMAVPIANAFPRLVKVIEAEGAKPSADGPDPALIDRMVTDLFSDIGDLWVLIALVDLAAVAVLAAAVARRLHDRDRTGLWGLLPMPFVAASIAAMPFGVQFAAGQRQLGGAETLLYLSGPFYWITLIVLVVLLAGLGDERENRFGPPPARDAT